MSSISSSSSFSLSQHPQKEKQKETSSSSSAASASSGTMAMPFLSSSKMIRLLGWTGCLLFSLSNIVGIHRQAALQQWVQSTTEQLAFAPTSTLTATTTTTAATTSGIRNNLVAEVARRQQAASALSSSSAEASASSKSESSWLSNNSMAKIWDQYTQWWDRIKSWFTVTSSTQQQLEQQQQKQLDPQQQQSVIEELRRQVAKLQEQVSSLTSNNNTNTNAAAAAAALLQLPPPNLVRVHKKHPNVMLPGEFLPLLPHERDFLNAAYEVKQPLLESFPEPAHVPLLRRNVTAPVPVVLYPYIKLGPNVPGQTFHLGQDGIFQSPFLKLSTTDMFHFNASSNIVWVADESGGGGTSFGPWCRIFVETMLQPALNDTTRGFDAVVRKQLLLSNNKTDDEEEVQAMIRAKRRTDFPPIHFLTTYTDLPSYQRCGRAEELIGRDLVLYFRRSVVHRRRWDETLQWVQPGRLHMTQYQRHINIPVRTDIVQQVAKHLQEKYKDKQLTLKYPIETLPRPLDVIHMWPAEKQKNDVSVLTQDGKLRYAVSRALVDLQKQNPSIHMFLGVKGKARWQGRNDVFSDYIDTCMSTKLHVVTQRDQWEDQFRLLEAMVTGALVLTDRMLTLPAGLVNGTNVLEFTSAAQLQHYIEYYLQHDDERRQMAAAGRHVAMSRHRSWHHMEQVIFGTVLSTCERLESVTPDCPYTVHSVEPSPEQPPLQQ